jgi:hypothetical protein
MAGYSPSFTVRVTGDWRGRAVDQRYTCSQAGLTRWATLLGHRLIVVRVTQIQSQR